MRTLTRAIAMMALATPAVLGFAGIAVAGAACAMTLAALLARSVVRARDMAALSAALADARTGWGWGWPS